MDKKYAKGSRMTAKRVDANQKQIVKELRDIGYSVMVMSDLGHGKPDVCVGTTIGGKPTNFLFEIKDGSKPPSRRKLTNDEIEFFAKWEGQVNIIHTAKEAVMIMEYANL
jgi:hypothetical protein